MESILRLSWLPWLGAVALLAGAVSAAAQGSGAERRLSLTAYNTDLAVVRDARVVEVASGTHWLPFRDVPSRIDPTSVHLKVLEGPPLDLLEQNYRYDLVSQDAVLDRYLDQPIRATLEDGQVHEGTLLSHAGGRILLGGTEGGEGLVILNPEKITDLRLAGLPSGLITRPTLEWLLAAERSGPRRLEVSYMTGGVNWHAEYVAVVAEGDAALNLTGWVSLDNRSGATYDQADLQLVAGDVHRVQPPRPKAVNMRDEAQMMAGERAPQFAEEELFEYHLYSLDRVATIRDNETKQLALFSPADVRVAKVYEANPRRDGTKVRVVLEFENAAANGLGMPLPRGTLRVFKQDRRARLQFVGEDRIDHTPRDEQVRIFVGNAFDLVVERTETDVRQITQRVRETDVEVEVRNRKEREDAVVVIQEEMYGDWDVLRSSHPHEKVSARKLEFRVPAAAGETVKLSFTVRNRY